MKSTMKTIMAFLMFLACIFPGATAAGELSRTTLKVEKLTCVFCVKQISARLKRVPGVEGVRGNVRLGVVLVDHQPFLSGETVAGAVSGAGWPAKVVSTARIDEGKSFSSSAANRLASSCCGKGDAPPGNTYTESPGRGCYSCNRGCGASAAAWKRLFWGSPDKKEDRRDAASPEASKSP